MGPLAAAGGSMCWRVNCGHRRRADRGPPHLVGNHGRGPCLSLHLRAQGRVWGCGRARWLKLYKLCVCVCACAEWVGGSGGWGFLGVRRNGFGKKNAIQVRVECFTTSSFSIDV